MKCRRINPENGMVVWFGVKDVIKRPIVEPNVDEAPDVEYENVAVFQDSNDKHANYAEKAEAVANSLKQWLSVIKHELWYDYEYGMPITDKIKSKAIIDAYIVEKVMQHPDVMDITDFESRQDGHFYTCYFIVSTIYGQIEVGI